MKLLKVFCVVALVFLISGIAYAETQSVKVSGDIAVRGFARDNYDLNKDDASGATANTNITSNDWATYLLSTTEVQVDADLTDNVSGTVRLVNQRIWGNGRQTNTLSGGELGTAGAPIRDVFTAARAASGVADSYEVMVDLAYIQLKEFLYSPLTLKIGRQDIWLGKGFVIGLNQQNPNGIYPTEYTAINSFDAIRATLDYSPWTIDLIFAKVAENARRVDDDTNLWVANVGYVFDSYNAEAEGYYIYNQDRNTGAGMTATTPAVSGAANDNDIHCFGLRGSFDPIEDWTVALEGAYQFGHFIGVSGQTTERDRSAWALDAMLECRYWQSKFAWRPVLQAEYIYYSGEENMGNASATETDTYSGWDPLYRGKYDTAIREFQNVYYGTSMASSPSFTNQHQIFLTATVEPTDSLTVSTRGAYFWLDEDYTTTGTNPNTDKDIGGELDVQVTWDYTEDVTFGLLTGFFFPGDHFSTSQDDVATDIVGTVKLSF